MLVFKDLFWLGQRMKKLHGRLICFNKRSLDQYDKNYYDRTSRSNSLDKQNVYSWQGTIYITSMCSTTVTDKTRRDAANPDSDTGIVGHSDKGGNITT
jgi:hypothetical protein